VGWGENFRENPTFYSSLCHQEHSYFSPFKIFYVKHVCIFASTCVLPRVFIFICVSAIVRIRICVFTLHLYFESFILVDWIVLYCKHFFYENVDVYRSNTKSVVVNAIYFKEDKIQSNKQFGNTFLFFICFIFFNYTVYLIF